MGRRAGLERRHDLNVIVQGTEVGKRRLDAVGVSVRFLALVLRRFWFALRCSSHIAVLRWWRRVRE